MRAKLNVLFIQSQAVFGADSLIHAEIMRYLDRDRFIVHVACNRGDGTQTPPALAAIRQIPNVHVRLTDFAPGLWRRSVKDTVADLASAVPAFTGDFVKLRNYVRDNEIDILHGTEKPRDASYVWLLSRMTKAKSIVHVHVKWSKDYSLPAKFSIQHADAALAISRYVRDTIVDMGKPASEVFTVLNALDATSWDPANADGRSVRHALGLPDDSVVLASVSRLFSWKGQTELIRALALVKPKAPNVRVLIVGEDDVLVHGGSYSAELKALVKSLNLEENVIFTGFRRDVANIMAACDIFAMPSFEEPFGVVFLEAMAIKKPIIAIDNGGTPEVVEHRKSGLLSPAWDIPSLAANMLELINDEGLRRQMGEYGRHRALDFFNPKRMADEVGAVYEKVAGR